MLRTFMSLLVECHGTMRCRGQLNSMPSEQFSFCMTHCTAYHAMITGCSDLYFALSFSRCCFLISVRTFLSNALYRNDTIFQPSFTLVLVNAFSPDDPDLVSVTPKVFKMTVTCQVLVMGPLGITSEPQLFQSPVLIMSRLTHIPD